jgi:hypothetical protein
MWMDVGFLIDCEAMSRRKKGNTPTTAELDCWDHIVCDKDDGVEAEVERGLGASKQHQAQAEQAKRARKARRQQKLR